MRGRGGGGGDDDGTQMSGSAATSDSSYPPWFSIVVDWNFPFELNLNTIHVSFRDLSLFLSVSLSQLCSCTAIGILHIQSFFKQYYIVFQTRGVHLKKKSH